MIALLQRPEARRALRWAFFLALAAGTWLALTPAPPEISTAGSDKLRHGLAFGLLLIFARGGWPRPRLWLQQALPLLGYGLFIELAQHQLPPRTFEWLDLAADGAGLLVAGLLLQLRSR